MCDVSFSYHGKNIRDCDLSLLFLNYYYMQVRYFSGCQLAMTQWSIERID